MVVPTSPAHDRQLAQLVRERFVAGAVQGLDSVDKAIEELLSSLLNQVATARENQLRRDMWSAYQHSRAAWVSSTAKAWRNGVQQSANSTVRVRPNTLSLELVGDDVVENKILSSRMALPVIEKVSGGFDDLRVRVQQVEYQGDDFVPEVDDHLDRAVLREFIELTGSCLTQSRVLGVLNQTLADDAIIVAAAGSLPGDLQRAWRSKGVNTYHVEYGYSCMGYEINAALGVKLAEPTKEVYALVGDGSYMMLHSELATSIQERRKINVVLLDNMAFGCINNLQIGNGMDSFGTEFRYRDPESGKLDGALVPVDFAMSAAAYGCKTYKVSTVEQLEAALADARTQTVSTLIDIKVLPKTMIHGYLSWWRVGVAQVSTSERTNAAAKKLNEHLAKARQY